MPDHSYSLRFKGLLNLPGVTPSSRKVAEDILRFDTDEHHCFYRAPSLHNHLSHQYASCHSSCDVDLRNLAVFWLPTISERRLHFSRRLRRGERRCSDPSNSTPATRIFSSPTRIGSSMSVIKSECLSPSKIVPMVLMAFMEVPTTRSMCFTRTPSRRWVLQSAWRNIFSLSVPTQEKRR